VPATVLRGLYAITSDDVLAAPDWLDRVEAAVRGGARILQYRAKGIAPARRLEQARALVALCARLDVLCIINDDPQLAHACDATGVHLGREDLDVAAARAVVGTQALIGVSCYNELARARVAQAQGADYVAFGSFYPSPTKPEAARAEPALLRAAKRELRVPVVAIGGITPENGAALIEAGADMLAAIEGVFGHADVATAARRYAELFS
jgi:thiamine-phosphate pyrophosphorylase